MMKKGLIPHFSAPTHLIQNLGSKLVANNANYDGFTGFTGPCGGLSNAQRFQRARSGSAVQGDSQVGRVSHSVARLTHTMMRLEKRSIRYNFRSWANALAQYPISPLLF
jgi:hypothetical protein